MTEITTALSQLDQQLCQGGVDAVLEQLVAELRENRQYHELFEALKMQVRRRLGLPLLYHDLGDELEETRRNQLEDGLLDACRQVGMLLLEEGRIREGWMYLRPVGNRAEAAAKLAQVAVDDENLEEMIEVLLHEGVDPARGYALVLEHYGTCNAITTYESALQRHSPRDQQTAAGLLVEHVHSELLRSVKADIAQREGREPQEDRLEELVASRPSLFGEYSYHIDTTHLASTIRSARVLSDPRQLRLALDLTSYGRRLHKQFQYPGEEPFADLYPSHALYLSALLGRQVDEAVEYFRHKAHSLDPAQHSSTPIETYVHLLDRLGRPGEAIDALLQYAERQQTPAQQLLPLLLDLSKKANSFEPLLEFCQQRGDLLGYATALMHKAEQQPECDA